MNGKVKLQAPAREAPRCPATQASGFPRSPPRLRPDPTGSAQPQPLAGCMSESKTHHQVPKTQSESPNQKQEDGPVLLEPPGQDSDLPDPAAEDPGLLEPPEEDPDQPEPTGEHPE